MNPALLTDLGRRGAAGQILLPRLHLRQRGDAYRLYAGEDAVTVALPAEEAAGVACRLCGVVPSPEVVAAVIESAVPEQPGG